MLLVEDRALLLRFRRGERDALEEVYEAYAAPVAAFLRAGFSFSSGGRRCQFRGARSQWNLEDRLHDVFSKAFAEPARLSYDGLSPYKAYILTIARNVVIDDFRRKENVLIDYAVEEIEERAHEPASSAAEPLHGAVELTGDPAADAEAAELAGLVSHFKASLPEREREVFKMRFLDEQEHQDIAQATGLSPSKIKTSEQRIRERFFEFMQGHGYFAGYRRERGGWLRILKSLSI